MTRIAAVALAGLFVGLSIPFHAAHAAKAQFERTKPHIMPPVPSGNGGSSRIMWNGSLPNGAGNGMGNGLGNGMGNGMGNGTPNRMPSPAAPRLR
jgi:hypothetical protein